MKTFSLTVTAAVLGVAVAPVNAWWDNGHMLVGEVASQLMDPADVSTLKTVLSKWESDFPNTNELSTAAIWPDLLKCKGMCQSPNQPSFSAMESWHFMNLPVNVDGSKWGGLEAEMKLFDYNMGGSAIDVLEKTVTSFATTKSVWAANLLIRNFIHIFGDLHQPLHTVAGISAKNPKGDSGGNLYVFQTPCAFANLHALWDAAAGTYSQNNWSKDTSAIKPALQANASALIDMFAIVKDTVMADLDQYKPLPYADFSAKVMQSSGSVFKRVALDSYTLTQEVVYSGFDLTYITSTQVACPPQSYMDWVSYIAQLRIATAGRRMSVFLTQFARQIRALDLIK